MVTGEQVVIFLDIAHERARQEQLKAAGRFTFTCADLDMTPCEKFAVLGEEAGEVAKEALTWPARPLAADTKGSRQRLRTELIQVAAVAVAWVEALDKEGTP